jgi:hypothetical protein
MKLAPSLRLSSSFQCRDVNLDIVLLHDQTGPYFVEELIFGYNVAFRQGEDVQNVQRAAPEADGRALKTQRALAQIETERSERDLISIHDNRHSTGGFRTIKLLNQ